MQRRNRDDTESKIIKDARHTSCTLTWSIQNYSSVDPLPDVTFSGRMQDRLWYSRVIEGPVIWSRVPETTLPRATLAEVTFSLFLSKIQPAVYIRIANSSRGARQLGWASCLTSAGRVTLASGTTFLHINALARLTGTSLGVANVT